ncbi:MAG TPA: hypothetical protein VNO23_03045, partial [Candidatus Binatia bacterium]|nr:hypothetical protein [Candidatus Binatia bacterium]
LARVLQTGPAVRSPGWQASAAFVLVGLDDEGEDIGRVIDALEPLGIRAEIVARGHQVRRAPTVVVRIPADRVDDALVALEAKGFGGVLAYEVDAETGDRPTPEGEAPPGPATHPPRTGR